MIEFQHLITQAEVDSEFINLTDKSGNKYGPQIGRPDKVFTVVDDAGKQFEMKRHHGNQLTRCTAWFTEHAIRAGTLLTIRFDPHAARIYLLSQPPAAPPAPWRLGSVSFMHDGDHYEIQCVADGEVVRVCGLRDGKQVGGFDFPPSPQIRRRRRDMSEYV
jgi:hypothetical protein